MPFAVAFDFNGDVAVAEGFAAGAARRNTESRREHGSAVSELFDDAEPEIDSLAEAMDDFDRIETFRLYVREGLDELHDWLREQPND